jgi:hypothetical protein
MIGAGAEDFFFLVLIATVSASVRIGWDIGGGMVRVIGRNISRKMNP